MRRASIREVIVQWHDYVVIELFEMNEDNIVDANEGLNEFDDNPSNINYRLERLEKRWKNLWSAILRHITKIKRSTLLI